ncbi:MAG: HD domain-containing phosphohydrolase, partial [Bacteroidota bacterium]
MLSRFRFKNDLKDVPMIASSHHERFDGHGYPRGLKG